MKIEDYRLLITLDETKTLRKAAEILYISQPAVTQRLKSNRAFIWCRHIYPYKEAINHYH